MSGRSSEHLQSRRGKARQAEGQVAWQGFVDVPLTDEDKASLAEGHFEAADAFSFLEEMVEDGYKVSVSQDAKNSCYVASATGRRPDDPNNGYTLTGRGPDVVGSLASLAYKHITLCERGAWSNRANGTGASAWS